MRKLLVLVLVCALILGTGAMVVGAESSEEGALPISGAVTFEYDTAVGAILGDLNVYYPVGSLKIGAQYPFVTASGLTNPVDVYSLYTELEIDEGFSVYISEVRHDTLEPVFGVAVEF